MVKTDGQLVTCCYGESIQGLNRSTHTIEQAFNSPEFQQIRLNLINGVKDSHCKKCWELEEQGVESLRQQELRTEEFDISVYVNPRLEYLFLSLSNQCNLKCRTCSPSDSSFWIKEFEQRTGIKKTVYLEPDDSVFFSSFKKDTLSHLKEIAFTGGEPLMMKSVQRILETLDPNVSLTFYTNGTFYNPGILEKFKDVSIAVSMDGIDRRFEYMRHPAKWHEVVDNLKLMGSNLKAITCTISAYNVWYIDEVADFADSLGVDFMAHILFDPNNLSVLSLPYGIRLEIAEKLSKHTNSQIRKIAEYLKTECSDNWASFAEDVQQGDSIRQENYKEIFPEFYSILEQHGKTI
jgi:sulfatase maturation enzyme AslB (radical SAM superfamily)